MLVNLLKYIVYYLRQDKYYIFGGNMKKKLLISLGLLLFILFTGGIWAYNYYFTLNAQINTQLEEQFGADFFDFRNLTIHDFNLDEHPSSFDSDKTVVLPHSDNTDEQLPTVSTQKDIEQQDSKQTTVVPSKKTSNKEDEATQVKPAKRYEKELITEESIINTYVPELKQLEAFALDRLDILFTSALQEYKQKKKEGTLNKSDLSRKYLQASKKLENGVDQVFNQIVAEMKMKLTQNNYSTQIIQDIQKKYKDTKSKKMAEFLREAKNL
jgi:hypothetical protein